MTCQIIKKQVCGALLHQMSIKSLVLRPATPEYIKYLKFVLAYLHAMYNKQNS